MTLILMLEDDHDRIRRFRRIVQERFPLAMLSVSRTAHVFIAAYSVLPKKPDLICLDHDLFPDSPSDPDPGDGRDASNFLITQVPSCPVLIHSTNADAADSMMYSMRDAGWFVERISPLGDDWIESYWFPTVQEMLSPPKSAL